MASGLPTGVLAGIERATGYPDRPPQPLGFEMEPFDESILAVVRSRGPQYRDTREGTFTPVAKEEQP